MLREESRQSLESLSFVIYLGGSLIILMGIYIFFSFLIDGDPVKSLVGLFILTSGYALVKISERLSGVLNSEK